MNKESSGEGEEICLGYGDKEIKKLRVNPITTLLGDKKWKNNETGAGLYS